MPKYRAFGIEMDRLVYALAGNRFQTDIACANRYIADRIHYAENSVLAMRQGNFCPKSLEALETLIEIGKDDAELTRAWADRLLRAGRHPDPNAVLQRHYPQAAPAQLEIPAAPEVIEAHEAPEVCDEPPAVHTADRMQLLPILYRLLGGATGSFIALLLWTYLVSRVYPAPHELPFLKEALWGLLVGLGLAVGLAPVDFLLARRNGGMRRLTWAIYLLLPAAGVLGALLWNMGLAKLFASGGAAPLRSTALETLCFGATYGLAFAVGTLAALWVCPSHPRRPREYALALVFLLVTGLAALVGFILVAVQPSFASQKDVDVFVGILIRLGLALCVAVLFPRE